VDQGGVGSVAEGFVNFPLSPVAAVRLVGWDEHDAGYISNVRGTNASAGIVNGVRTFPTSGTTLSNAGSVNSDYNTVETRGGRAALKLDIGENWTVTPTFMGQSMSANGFFGFDPAVGNLELVHFGPENTQDSFAQAALTIEGKVSDFDIVYSGGWLVRNTHSIADYSDYSYFYDKYYGSGAFWHGNGATPGTLGPPIEPQEFVITNGHYTKWSNELRVNTPQQYAVKGTLGVFAQRQVHEIWEDYVMPGLGGNPYIYNTQGLAQTLTMPGLSNNTIWLTDEERVDRDSAIFGQATWDITSGFSLTGGLRFYKYDNSLQGFYGYSSNYGTLTGYYPGMNICGPTGGTPSTTYQPFHFAPCTDLNADVNNTGHTERLTLNYKFDHDRMVYATYSTGFRPGGVNRVYDATIKAIYPPYQADQLKNYEVGWKTQWFDQRVRWNGAIFLEDWNDFQFSFLGPNSVTVVQNAASAQIKGIETNFEWAAGGGWLLSASGTYLDAKLTQNFCGSFIPGTETLATNCPGQVNSYADGTMTMGPLAAAGTKLPVVPSFKGNAIARYNFGLGDWNSNVQAAFVYQTSSSPLLYPVFNQHLGDMPAYGLLNLSTGIERNGLQVQLFLSNALDKLGELTRFAQCTPTTCTQPYVIPVQPRTIELRFGQKF
jgi:iron complex outermembrane recepter protein